MTRAVAAPVFLLDVDGTLLDNDAIHADLDERIADDFGPDEAARYWTLYEALRRRLGYADYLGAIQAFRLECGDEVRAQQLAAFLLDYPFRDRLYPRALEAIAHLSRIGTCVVLSDGDVVLQPRKIERSGIARAVDGRVLIYVHKERMLADVARRFPGPRYAMLDDKLRVLDGMRREWRQNLTTVFIRQGHYANDPVECGRYPRAQIELAGISEICALGTEDFLPSRQTATLKE